MKLDRDSVQPNAPGAQSQRANRSPLHAEPTATAKTTYERNQSFNRLVRFLHAFRFDYLMSEIRRQGFSGKIKVVEVGCAHAHSFALLDANFPIDYVGIELDEESCRAAQERFGHCGNFQLLQGSVADFPHVFEGADVVLALETLEHIPDPIVVRVIEQIAAARPRLFYCSVPNEVGPMIWIKNLGSVLMGYKRHKFYSWKETYYSSIGRMDKLPPHTTMHRGFDWRWLGHTIIQNMQIDRYLTTPFRGNLRFLSPSIIFVCKPYDSSVGGDEAQLKKVLYE